MKFKAQLEDALDTIDSKSDVILIVKNEELTLRLAKVDEKMLVISISILVEDLFTMIYKKESHAKEHLKAGLWATTKLIEDIAVRVENGDQQFSRNLN